MLYFLIALGVILITGLAFYAGQLLWQVKQQNMVQQEQKDKRLNYLTDSIRYIAKAMKEEQCEISEGVLRIWVLLDHYNSEQDAPKDYPALYPGFAALYDVIKDMPTHEARKKQGKQERFKMDVQRWDAEKEHGEQISADISGIITEFEKKAEEPKQPATATS